MKKNDLDDDITFDSSVKKDIKGMKRDFAHINSKAKKVFRKLGVSGSEIKEYMSDARNFTESEWLVLKEAKETAKQLKKNLFDALGYKPKKKKKSVKKEQQVIEEELIASESKKEKFRKKIDKKRTQDPKSKRHRKRMVGFKKGWVQMD